MGRDKKHITPEEKRLANLKKATNYYWRNKSKIDERSREAYRKKRLLEIEQQQEEKEVTEHPSKIAV